MEFLIFYLIFALATSFTAAYELMFPVISEQKLLEGKVNDITLIYVTFFILCMLIAPIMLIACLVPSIGESSREHLRKGLFEQV